MKRLVHHYEIEEDPNASHEDIYGMARVGYIPTKGGFFEIYVNSDDPEKLPHFHVRNKDDWGAFHTCVRIDCAEYFKHSNKCDDLNSKEKRDLQKFMCSPAKTRKKNIKMNNWEYICMLWDTNNSDVEIPEEVQQPDYTQL